MSRSICLLIALCVIIINACIQTVAPVEAAQRCFDETQQCVDGRFAEFWEQNGGLPVFGFPLAAPTLVNTNGSSFVSQRFERALLELHPELNAPYDVLLGRMGALQLEQQKRDWRAFPIAPATAGCKTFTETGHAICGAFLKTWRSNGLQIDGKPAVSDSESLALFGLPLSDVLTETLSDGKQYQVQWFERARFEFHPELPASYQVLLGLLGKELIPSVTPQATATVMPVTTPTPIPLPISAAELKRRMKLMPIGYWKKEFESITFIAGSFQYFDILKGKYPATGKRFLRCSLILDNRRTNPNDMVFIDVSRIRMIDSNFETVYVAVDETKSLNNDLLKRNAYPGVPVGGDVLFEISTNASPIKIQYIYDFAKQKVELVLDEHPFR